MSGTLLIYHNDSSSQLDYKAIYDLHITFLKPWSANAIDTVLIYVHNISKYVILDK